MAVPAAVGIVKQDDWACCPPAGPTARRRWHRDSGGKRRICRRCVAAI